jgi:hypothetical protein
VSSCCTFGSCVFVAALLDGGWGPPCCTAPSWDACWAGVCRDVAVPPFPPSRSVPVIYHDFSLEVFLSEEAAGTPWEPVATEDPVEMGVHELSLRAFGRVKMHHLWVSAPCCARAVLCAVCARYAGRCAPGHSHAAHPSSCMTGCSHGCDRGRGCGRGCVDVQEGNKQSLLARLTRKHWATITALAKAVAAGDGTFLAPSASSALPLPAFKHASQAVFDAVTAAVRPTAAQSEPPRPPRSSSDDGPSLAQTGLRLPRSRSGSLSSAGHMPPTVADRLQASLYKVPTLLSLFDALPGHLAFDVEVKYPVEVGHRWAHRDARTRFGSLPPPLCPSPVPVPVLRLAPFPSAALPAPLPQCVHGCAVFGCELGYRLPHEPQALHRSRQVRGQPFLRRHFAVRAVAPPARVLAVV